jgi:hypothetical protein
LGIENRELKVSVGEKTTELQRKESEAVVGRQTAAKTEEQLRREILEFKKVDNPFNTTMANMTQMMGNTPFENSVLGGGGPSSLELARMKENYERKIYDLNSEKEQQKSDMESLRKELTQLKVQLQIAKSNAQMEKFQTSLNESRLGGLNDSRMNKTQFKEKTHDESERIARLYKEMGELRQKYVTVLSENDDLKKKVSLGASGAIGDPKDKERIEGLRRTNEKLMDEIIKQKNANNDQVNKTYAGY